MELPKEVETSKGMVVNPMDVTTLYNQQGYGCEAEQLIRADGGLIMAMQDGGENLIMDSSGKKGGASTLTIWVPAIEAAFAENDLQIIHVNSMYLEKGGDLDLGKKCFSEIASVNSLTPAGASIPTMISSATSMGESESSQTERRERVVTPVALLHIEIKHSLKNTTENTTEAGCMPWFVVADDTVRSMVGGLRKELVDTKAKNCSSGDGSSQSSATICSGVECWEDRTLDLIGTLKADCKKHMTIQKDYRWPASSLVPAQTPAYLQQERFQRGSIFCIDESFPRAANRAFSPVGNMFYFPPTVVPVDGKKQLTVSCGGQDT